MSSNPVPSPFAAVEPSIPGPVRRANTVTSIFLGPNGLRAGWRILIFMALFVAQGKVLNLVLHRIPAVAAMHKALPPDVMTPGVLMFDEGLSVALLLLTAFWMTLIEGRSFADYYLPPKASVRQTILARRAVRIRDAVASDGDRLRPSTDSRFKVSPRQARLRLKFALLYAIGFFFVGMTEEFLMRGYMQFTLGSGIGFWPSALVLSLLFGLGHIQNIGEDWFGAVMAGSFGILAAFALFRTGNIWFAIGMHLGWDWGETFFYGVPDSGFKSTNYLLNSTLTGPHWISGGSVGPEGSAFALAVLAIAAVGIHFLFPARRAAA